MKRSIEEVCGSSLRTNLDLIAMLTLRRDRFGNSATLTDMHGHGVTFAERNMSESGMYSMICDHLTDSQRAAFYETGRITMEFRE